MSILSRLRKNDAKAAAKKADTKAGKKSSASAAPMSASGAVVNINQRTLLHPLVTEKATLSGTYQFEVPLSVNKVEVAKAIERLYGVKPLHVRMMRMEGKSVRGTYRTGKRKDWKKAIVRLPAGKTINVYEGV
jgi:large subunit ribosomal protein L23